MLRQIHCFRIPDTFLCAECTGNKENLINKGIPTSDQIEENTARKITIHVCSGILCQYIEVKNKTMLKAFL